MSILFKIWCVFLLIVLGLRLRCPECGGKVYCKGGASEADKCFDCNWGEFN